MTRRTKRIIVATAVVLALALVVLLLTLYSKPLWHLFRSRRELHRAIMGWGVWAPVGLILLQIVQIVVAPLPGAFTAAVGGAVFGVWYGFLLCMIGVAFGASITFLLGKVLGRRVLKLFVPQVYMNRFDAYIVRRGPAWLFILMFIPTPIGDWIFYLVGMTAIPFPVFLVVSLLGRMPSNLLWSFLGRLALNLAWWQWAALLAALVPIVILYYLNRKRLDRFFARVAGFDEEEGSPSEARPKA